MKTEKGKRKSYCKENSPVPYTFFITFRYIWNIDDFNWNFKPLKFLNFLPSKQLSPSLFFWKKN